MTFPVLLPAETMPQQASVVFELVEREIGDNHASVFASSFNSRLYPCNFYRMRQRTHRRHCKVWTSILVLLVQVLLPLMLHAPANARGHSTEICTAHGIKTVVSDGDAGASQQHCQLCVPAQQDAYPGVASHSFLPLNNSYPLPAVAGASLLPAAALVLHLRGPPAV